MPAIISEPVDRDLLEASVASALADQQTLIFLDTSTLIWIYRLHDGARVEFIDWLQNGPPPGRTHIPRRALHEFSRYRRNPQVLLPFKRQLGNIPSLLTQVNQWAHLIADDAHAKKFGFADRAEYFSLIERTKQGMERIIKPITSSDSLNQLDAQLIPIFDSLCLDIDIYENIAGLQAEYEARAEVRMPPGFKDIGKDRRIVTVSDPDDPDLADAPDLAGANRFGDFAIWKEILAFSAGQKEVRSVVIITHDQKVDWLYIPTQIIDSDRRIKPNHKGQFRVTVPHPLLSHEILKRAQVTELHIITTPQLAYIASKNPNGAYLTELARAVQAEVTADVREVPVRDDYIGEATGSEPVNGATPEADDRVTRTDSQSNENIAASVDRSPLPADAVEFLASPPAEALADRLYVHDRIGSSVVDTQIQKLKSLNWYTQNPAAKAAMDELRTGTPSLLQSFILGRNIYQAACGSAATPIDILNNLSEELIVVPEGKAQVLYAGALCEVYLDKNGQIRKVPKAEQISSLFLLQDDRRFIASVRWLRERLKAVEDHYLVLPSEEPVILTLDMTIDEEEIVTAITIDGMELTQAEDGGFDGTPLPSKSTYERLRQRISRHFAIPEQQYLLLPEFEGQKAIGALQLKRWGPKTDIVLNPPRPSKGAHSSATYPPGPLGEPHRKGPTPRKSRIPKSS